MIYICTHKDFNEVKKNGEYTIVSTHKLNNKYNFPIIYTDNDLKPLELSYSEGYSIKEIYLNLLYNNAEWIGINHYRRYFDITPKDTNNTILPVPLNFNMHMQYAACHNINDLIKVEQIIDTFFPEYKTDYNNINVLFPCNMFVMKKYDFKDYYNFVFGVLKIFSQQNGLYTDADVKRYVESNRKYYRYPNFDINYQSRLHGFLMERLSTIFFLKHFKNKNVIYKEIQEYK